MAEKPKYPVEWLREIPAKVFASLRPGEIRVLVSPSEAVHDIPIGLVPPELRIPNTSLWVELDQSLQIVRVWRRDRSV